MLALVLPYTQDVPHRPQQSARNKSNISSSSTTSSSSSSSSTQTVSVTRAPSIQRNLTAPPAQRLPHRPIRIATPPPPPRPATPPPTPVDIHSFPPHDLLRLLASLLTQIAATNDYLAPASPSSASPTSQSHISTSLALSTHPQIWPSLTSASRSALSTRAATLTFHARNIPTITLEAYLLRILKYCPTTNHVFLSLLVYFDRMARLGSEATGRAFVIDSYNIHRLVIAGVTVASKFFSDVFYTNSRYAKVGGLPLPELNQLELQFLLLNDFRLVISSAEMQRYAEQLILFSRSSDTTNSSPSVGPTPPPPPSNGISGPMKAMSSMDNHSERLTDQIRPHARASTAPNSLPSQTDRAPSADMSTISSTHSDHSLIPSHTQSQSQAHKSSATAHARRFSTASCASTSTVASSADWDTETEEGSSTTDDEPTIRAGRAGDPGARCSLGPEESESEGDYDEEQEDARINGIEIEERDVTDVGDGLEDGERTPERRGIVIGLKKDGDGDSTMASP